MFYTCLRFHFQDILGKSVQRLAVLDKELAFELKSIADEEMSECQTIVGKTMCTYDFYEGNIEDVFLL